MDVDTEASASIISKGTYKTLWRGGMTLLQKTDIKLHTCIGEPLKVLGQSTVDVSYLDKESLPLLVVKGTGPSLLLGYGIGLPD